jgi:hypothetical protein
MMDSLKGSEMVCCYIGFSVLGAPRPIAVLLASLIASIISGDDDDNDDDDVMMEIGIRMMMIIIITISSYLTFLEVFKFIGRSSDHIIDGVGDGDEKLDVPEIMGKMEVGMLMMMIMKRMMMISMVIMMMMIMKRMMMISMVMMMMIAMVMKIGHDDDLSLSPIFLCTLQVTSLSGFPMLFAMMLTTQVRSAV